MIQILIVDDIDTEKIEKIIERKGSILKGKVEAKKAFCAIEIPKSKTDIYDDSDVALNFVKSAKNIDLAFLDIGYQEEYSGDHHYKPILILIKAINEFHPYCQIIVMSDESTSPRFKEEYIIDDSDKIIVPSISKRTDLVVDSEYNKAFAFLLKNRLFKLINFCGSTTKELILGWLNSYNELSHFEIGSRVFNADSLFIRHLNNLIINKKDAYAELLEVLIDKPNFKESEWTSPKGKGSSTIRRYGLSAYYYDYFTYYYNNFSFSISTLTSLAKGNIKRLLDELVTNKDVKYSDKEFIENIQKFRLKTDLKLDKIGGRIAEPDMEKFIDVLLKRLLFLGYYFGCNLGVTGIVQKMQSKISTLDKDRYKWFNQYLLFQVQEQLSTENDLLLGIHLDIDQLKEVDAKQKSKYGKSNLAILSPSQRNYMKMYKGLANYEKEFVDEIVQYAISLHPTNAHKEHLEYINRMVLN